jgi:DNA-directed RNA polymerase subunit RPC12/RpoP
MTKAKESTSKGHRRADKKAAAISHETKAPEHEAKKCTHCGGKLVISRRTLIQSRSLWWQKPWGSTLTMDEPVVPYACMKCGGVFLFLRNGPKVTREYNQQSDEIKKRMDELQ